MSSELLHTLWYIFFTTSGTIFTILSSLCYTEMSNYLFDHFLNSTPSLSPLTSSRGTLSLRVRHLLHSRGCDGHRHLDAVSKDCGAQVSLAYVTQHARQNIPSERKELIYFLYSVTFQSM